MKIGYARVSTAGQDLAGQIDQLRRLGVEPDHIYYDHGFTGANRERPALGQVLAACREGDELVVSKLDRLGRSIRDLAEIADEIQAKGAALNINGSIYDPSDPMGKFVFMLFAMFAEFERDLIKQRTREGMAVAKLKGKLKGGKPKLSKAQEVHLKSLAATGDYTGADLAELFNVHRATVYRTLNRVPK